MNDIQKEQYKQMYNLLAEHAAVYAKSAEAQIAVWEDKVLDDHPLLLSVDIPAEYKERFPDHHPGETHHDKPKMLLSGMKAMLYTALAGPYAVPSIRANMGCGIFPSLFPGIKPLLFDDGKMPWVVDHLDTDTIRNLRKEDIVLTDEFKTALEHMAYIAEHIEGTGTYVYPLDLQGPFDTAHIVYGNQIFYDIYDEPELIHHLLDLCCYAIELGMTECFKTIPDSDKIITHYNSYAIPRSHGGAKISEDTSTLLSPKHIDEFVIPYTQRVLEFTGGGYIHYCGRNDHLLKRALELEKNYGINFGNTDKHDMDTVLKQTAQAGKIYLGHINKAEDEDHAAFFKRVRNAATVDGKCRLLLNYYSATETGEELLNIWNNTA